MSKHIYDPGPFADLAASPLGCSLWDFLNSETSTTSMEVATDLGHPAVAGVSEALLAEFGADVLPDRVKQLIGHMTRQVMERRGYVVDRMSVKLRSVPFASGTRYRKAGAMLVYAFRNSADGRDVCLTTRRNSNGLPKLDPGRWVRWLSFSTDLRATIGFGVRLDEVRREVDGRGYLRLQLRRIFHAA